jgi:hypothetical protein
VHQFTAATNGTAGHQKNTDYQPKENGEMKACSPETSLNSGPFKLSSLTESKEVEFSQAVELDD